MLKINSISYNWTGALSKRRYTKYIVIHHQAGNGGPVAIHNAHIANGCVGIGYHFVVRKDGSVYYGRPADCVGAHAYGFNSVSIGVCFEGNYETTKSMPEAQMKSGMELVSYLKNSYPAAEIKRHSELCATACPGQYFPFADIAQGVAVQNAKELESVNDIVWELAYRNIITDSELWLEKCQNDTDAYWLARKAANMTVNNKIQLELVSVNDIVWELNQRNIITDTTLWLEKLDIDGDLYWLAYKTANLTQNK